MMSNSELKKILDVNFNKYTLSPMTGGATQAGLYLVTTSTHDHFVLKVQAESLAPEYLNYQWLQGKAPVPKIIFYKKLKDLEALCITKLKGQTLEYFIGRLEEKEIISHYARSLQLLHSLKPDEQCLVQNIESRLLQAENNVKNSLIDRSQLEQANQHYETQELYEQLLSLQPDCADLVFTHGDYCFDNLIFDNEQLSGFIDLGNGGLADKYQDLAIAARSIREYFDDEWVNFFYKEYGLAEVDNNKLAFYTLLDEFF